MSRLLLAIIALAALGCTSPELLRKAGVEAREPAGPWPELAVTAELAAAGDRARADAQRNLIEAERLRARAERLRRRVAVAR